MYIYICIYIYMYDANMYIYMHELANLLSECTFQNGKMNSSSSGYTVILASVIHITLLLIVQYYHVSLLPRSSHIPTSLYIILRVT